MMRKYLAAAAIAALSGVSGSAMAAGVNFDTPPPASVIVVENGLEWIWAAPCAPFSPSCGAPGNPPGSYPIQGFRVPTLQEWGDAWTDRAELISRFMVGGVAVCGTPWMNQVHNHCDSGDMMNGAIWGASINGICDNNFFQGCSNAASETFLVRGAAVPVPATLVLALAGLGLAGWSRRKVVKA